MSRVESSLGLIAVSLLLSACGDDAPAPPAKPGGPSVLERAIDAMGGRERLEALRAARTKATVAQDGMTFPVETTIASPDRLHVVIDREDARFERVLVGEEGFGVFDGVPYDLSSEEIASDRQSLRVAEIALLTRLLSPDATVKAAPPLDGSERLEVRFESEPEGPFELRFDATTARLRSIHWQATIAGRRGRPRAAMTYGDWRSIDGVLAAFALTTTVEGEPPSTSTLTSLSWEAPDPKVFERPKGPPPIFTRDLGPETVALWERSGDDGPDSGAAAEKLAAFVTSRGLQKRGPIFRLLTETDTTPLVGVAVAPPAAETRPSSSSVDSLRVTTLPAGRVLTVAVPKPDDAALKAAATRLKEEAARLGYEAAKPPLVVGWSDDMAQVRLSVRPK
jgi:hypothetical protein